MPTKISLTSFLAFPLEKRKELVIVRSFLKKNKNGNKKTILLCESLRDVLLFKASLRDSRAKKAPRKLGKPSKHLSARAVTNLGNRPKIVTGNMFPNRKNIVHFKTKESENAQRYSYDPYKVFLKPEGN